jgi:hypothetical protein
MEPYEKGAADVYLTPFNTLLERDKFDVIVRMTLLLTLLFPGCNGGLWPFQMILSLASIAGLVNPAITRKPDFWVVLGLSNFALQNVFNWAYTDNHVCLYSYWYLAISCAIMSRAPMPTLAANARCMIGLVFLFATFQKILSIEYTRTCAVKFFLLSDRRFLPLVQLVGVQERQCATIRRSMDQLLSPIQLPGDAALSVLATSITWWTVLIEAVIAIAFLLPRTPLIGRAPDVPLFVFIMTVTPIATVMGFAWILLIMGYSQCLGHKRKTIFTYHLIFILLICFRYAQLKMLASRLIALFT